MKYLLIDFENIQPLDLKSLQAENIKIWIFYGLHQKNISIDLCKTLCSFGKNVSFIQLDKIGSNALDFYIAYYIGRITQQDPEAEICILTKDKGHDSLITHINQNQLAKRVFRSVEHSSKHSTEALSPSKQKAPKIPAVNLNGKKVSDAEKVILRLQSQIKNRPATVKALKNSLKVWLKYSDDKIDTVFNILKKQGYIVVENKKVTYKKLNE